MYQKVSQVKASARNNLRGHYGLLIAVTIVSLLVILLLNMPFRRMMFRGFYMQSALWILAGAAGALVISIIYMLFSAGLYWIHLKMARGRKVLFRDVLYPFTCQPGKFIANGLLRIAAVLICLLPGLILLFLSVDIYPRDFSYQLNNLLLWYLCNIVLPLGVIVCVVVMRSWTFSTFLLLEHPNMSVMQAIHESRQLLNGNKGRRLHLFFSFLGLLFLSLLCFFLSLLWLWPYMRQSMICFYLDIESVESGEGA